MRLMRLCLVCAIMICASHLAIAGDCCCQVQCPRCDHVCKLSVEKDKEKHHCWQVECKPICIPQVTFPWQKCCEPKCAKLKYVRVLKKVEYECPVCKYEWSAEPAACCDRCPCDEVLMKSPATEPPALEVPVQLPAAPTAGRSRLLAPLVQFQTR